MIDKIVVGLGNPGKKYAWTRHNIGSCIVQAIAASFGVVLKEEKKLKCSIGEIEVEGKRVLLVVPETYMNLSGEAVSNVLKETKLASEKMVVLFDDLETAFALHKICFEGGTRGHNGIRSIHQTLQSKRFFQLRFGIGRPQGDDIAEYVLSRFTETEMSLLANDALQKAQETIQKWVTSDEDK